MLSVLFVCHGNICRSPMAEFVMNNKLRSAGLEDCVHIESAALHTDEIGSEHAFTEQKKSWTAMAFPTLSRKARLAKRTTTPVLITSLEWINTTCVICVHSSEMIQQEN